MAALDTPLERGQALAIEGEYEAALEALTEATTEDASDAKAWEATAQVLLAASDDKRRAVGCKSPGRRAESCRTLTTVGAGRRDARPRAARGAALARGGGGAIHCC